MRRSPYLLTVPLSRVCEWRDGDEKCGLQSVHIVVMAEPGDDGATEVTTMEVCGVHTDAAHALFLPAADA